jgi:hypothetical protein
MAFDTNMTKKEKAAIPAPPESIEDDGLRSLTRLVIGAADIGIYELRQRLRRWEEEIDQAQTKEQKRSSQVAPDGLAIAPEEPAPGSEDVLRYALIGLMFDAQEVLKSGSVKVVKVGRRVKRRTSPILRPLTSSRLLSPARKSYKKLVAVGKRRVDHWIDIGRAEEIHSRMMAETALTGTVDETVDYLAEMPGVQELITSQTTSMAEELVEEIRERTVAADILLEGFARALFRRQPRHSLPPPPPAVQMSAITLRPAKNYNNIAGKV